jgi:Peptidase family C25
MVMTADEYPKATRIAHVFQDAPRNFDLLIVTPFAFADLFESFRSAKRSRGIEWHLVALHGDALGSGGLLNDFPGRDDPERIKNAIDYAHRVHCTKYVLLVGDASLLPVTVFRTSR